MKLVSVLVTAALLAGDLAAQIDLTVTPANATPGQMVTVKLTNNSNATWTLPTLCVFRSVHETGCQDTAVLNLFCGGSLVSVAPGQSVSQTWDQLDDNGGQVDRGTYAFRASIFDPSFTMRTFCAQVDISSCSTPPTHYGPSSAGQNGQSPMIGFKQDPKIGTVNFELRLADGIPTGNAIVLLGIPDQTGTPVGWGTVLLDTNLPIISSPVIGLDGQGNAVLPAVIPNDASLIGGTVGLQLATLDPSSTGNIAHSRGLSITICP